MMANLDDEENPKTVGVKGVVEDERPSETASEEDVLESEPPLEAQSIYVLMSKSFRLSRNARAQW
jgi:hypothetical protein